MITETMPNSKLLIIALVLLLQVTLSMNQVCIADICSCNYRFVEQPLRYDMCNPYLDGWFAIQCAVEHIPDYGAPLEVEWYTRDSNNDPVLFLGGKRQDNTDNDCNFLTSVLNVTLTSQVRNNFAGHNFFCRVSFSDGTKLKDSRGFLLIPQQFIIGSPNSCSDENVTIQSGPIRECINFTIPTEQGTTQPEPTTSTTDIHLIPSSTSVQFLTTPLPSATPDPVTPDINVNGGDGGDTNNMAERPLSNEEEILIYAAIGVAIFLFLIVFLLVICVCICSGAFHQRKVDTTIPVARHPTTKL